MYMVLFPYVGTLLKLGTMAWIRACLLVLLVATHMGKVVYYLYVLFSFSAGAISVAYCYC